MPVVGNLRRRGIRLMNDRVAAIMQIGHRRCHAVNLERSIRQPPGPLNGIPVDFEIRSETNSSRCARNKNVSQVNQADLLSTCGKSEVWTRYLPAAVAIGYF